MAHPTPNPDPSTPAQETALQDGAGAKPSYSLRTLSRALEYAAAALPVYGLRRSLWDGWQMSFATQLSAGSRPVLHRLMVQHLLGGTAAQLKVKIALVYLRLFLSMPCADEATP